MSGKVSNGIDFDPTILLDTQNEVTEIQDETSEEVIEDAPEEIQETVTENTDPDKETLKTEVETYKNRYSNLEKLLGKQSQELGELRKFYQQFQASQNSNPEESDENFVDKFVQNPKQAIQQEILRREAESQSKRIQESEIETNNLSQIYQAIPNFDNLKETIISIAREEDGIAQADMNMLEVTMKTDPLFAVQYAKRAILKQQLEAVTSKGKKVVDQLVKNSQRPTPIKASAPTTTNQSLSVDDIANLSDQELAKLKKQYGLI